MKLAYFETGGHLGQSAASTIWGSPPGTFRHFAVHGVD